MNAQPRYPKALRAVITGFGSTLRSIKESVIVEGIDSGHISTLLEVDRYAEELHRFLEGLNKT